MSGEGGGGGVPGDAGIAGCLAEAQGCNQGGCPSGTSTEVQPYPENTQIYKTLALEFKGAAGKI